MYDPAPPPEDLILEYQQTLEAGYPESRQSHQWRFNCPKCNHKNALHVNFKKEGAFMCFHCMYQGFYQKLRKDYGQNRNANTFLDFHVDRLDYTETPPDLDWAVIKSVYSWAYQNGSLIPSHLAWLNARGITGASRFFSTDTVFEKLPEVFSFEDLFQSGLYYKNSRGVIKARRIFSPGSVAIPYMDPHVPELVWYVRTRAVEPSNPKFKYHAPTFVPQRGTFFGAESVPQNAPWIFITEGEFKIRSAIELGEAGICSPGIQSSQREMAEFCASRGVKRVVLAYDTEGGKTSEGLSKQEVIIQPAVRRMAKFLGQYQIPSYQLVFPLMGEEKMDMDTFILRHAKKSAPALRKLVQESKLIVL